MQLFNKGVVGVALMVAASCALAGCFVLPGKFAAELVLVEKDRFTFTYDGEIHFVGLSNLAQMDAMSSKFEADACYDDDTFEKRACSESELAEQRAAWEASADARAVDAKREAEAMAAVMGGIDPSDPQAVEELRQLLLRHKGWQRVEPLGEGVFDVRYSISGTLSHDFLFPMIESFPVTGSFVQVHLRKDGLVRIDAPGFSPQDASNPLGGMMGGGAGLASMAMMGALESETDQGNQMPNFPMLDGTFTIVTDGAIRANNTDEGAEISDGDQTLRWNITPRTKTAPTALIDMTP